MSVIKNSYSDRTLLVLQAYPGGRLKPLARLLCKLLYWYPGL